jgi:hypothetical protein
MNAWTSRGSGENTMQRFTKNEMPPKVPTIFATKKGV